MRIDPYGEAAIYARVSTAAQNAEMQIRELKEYVRQRSSQTCLCSYGSDGI